jgi:protein-tyrosine-phosphatase
MMRFAATEQNSAIAATLHAAVERYGLNLLRADERIYLPELWANVRAYLDACGYGIAVLDKIDDPEFNPNVSLETGYMLAQDNPLLLLKEKRLRRLQSDLAGHLYSQFDSYDIENSVSAATNTWLRNIGVAKRPNERVVLFVSRGGTCRCAMAKILTTQAFEGRTLPFSLRAESVACEYGEINVASVGAKNAIRDKFNEDLLASHRVIRQNPGLIADADLILVMEGWMKEYFPAEKTFLFSEFFGGQGNVTDPWPSDTPGADQRYAECLNTLSAMIGDGGKLLAHLTAA